MSQRKNVNVNAPTLTANASFLSPKIAISSKTIKKIKKRILLTWIFTIFAAYIPVLYFRYAPIPLCVRVDWYIEPILGILLAIIPYKIGIKAVETTITTEISE